MFRQMRRSRQLLTGQDLEDIIKRSTSGVLSLLGDDGYPYGVPMSFVYKDNKFYFHCGKTGHKIDAIKNSNKASFTIIDKDEIAEEEYTSYFRSAIAFGKIKILEDQKEVIEAMKLLVNKYSPNESEDHFTKAMEGTEKTMSLLLLEVEHITGKEAIELVKMKSAK